MILKPTQDLSLCTDKTSVFLAGSIEMGKAVDWQLQVEQALSEIKNISIFNPRRDDWDASWEQSIHTKPFYDQVHWELEALEKATHIVFYFSPETQSPITLMELGLFARSGKAVVCCPEGFWRKGNIDIVCQKFNIPQVNTLEELSYHLKTAVQ